MSNHQIVEAIKSQAQKANLTFSEMFARVQAAAAKTEHWEILDQLCEIQAGMVGE